jgi:hypothetical protein
VKSRKRVLFLAFYFVTEMLRTVWTYGCVSNEKTVLIIITEGSRHMDRMSRDKGTEVVRLRRKDFAALGK